jgi:hypothetical protein
VEATVKASDLMKEYSTNAIAADGKYKGKVVQVSGKFGSVQKVPLMGYIVQLEPEDAVEGSMSYVQCGIVESAQDDVGKLKPGQKITMKGNCDGQVVAGQVRMSDCVLVK